MDTGVNLLKNIPIDYSIIHNALNFYKLRGYTYIEVPWFVDEEVSKATCPNDNLAFAVNVNDRLIGSAEQGFIHLMLNESKLENDRLYCAITPCFRNEPESETHSKTFMKLELFCKSDIPYIQNKIYKIMLNDAINFFNSYGINVSEVATLMGTDLEFKGLELGSYGIRTYKDVSWVYGTGVALPRMSLVI